MTRGADEHQQQVMEKRQKNTLIKSSDTYNDAFAEATTQV